MDACPTDADYFQWCAVPIFALLSVGSHRCRFRTGITRHLPRGSGCLLGIPSRALSHHTVRQLSHRSVLASVASGRAGTHHPHLQWIPSFLETDISTGLGPSYGDQPTLDEGRYSGSAICIDEPLGWAAADGRSVRLRHRDCTSAVGTNRARSTVEGGSNPALLLTLC